MGRSSKSAGQLLVEVLSITVAVVLGFAATEWGERQRDLAAGQEALAAVERELRANHAAVSRSAPYYRTMTAALVDEVESNGDGPLDASRIEEWRGLSPPLVRSASFQLALNTGALEHIEFAVADMLSGTYEVQSNLTLAIDQALAAMVAGDLARFSDWLRVTALLSELTTQSEFALAEAIAALEREGD